MRTGLFLLTLLVSGTLSAQHKLSIVVDGIEDARGKIFTAVYDSVNFRQKPLYATKPDALEGSVTVVMDGVASGEYAVSLFHDANENGELDRGEYGIPVEKTDASNNAKGRMGPPTSTDCKFVVTGDTVISITLTSYKMPK